MAPVSDKTLAWLWSVLQNGYHDPQRTYTSIARTLSAHPTLSPRTEVHTHDDGSSALLLTLSGTLPVAFRGTTYRFPLKLWVPRAYPGEPPLVYVTPGGGGGEMVIRPGQHVGVDGRVYHPYLRDWVGMGERADVEELLGFVRQVFEREPPVVGRALQVQYQRPIGQVPQQQQQQQQQPGAPPPPPPPPKQRTGSGGDRGDVPPPRPPKPGEEGVGVHQHAPSRDAGRDGPPLPPLPHERQASEQYQTLRPQQNGYAGPPRPPSQVSPPQPTPPGYQNGRPGGSPLPLAPEQRHAYPQQRQPPYERSPVSPVSPVAGHSRPGPMPPRTQNQYQHYPPPLPSGSQYPSQQPLQHPQYQRQAQPYPPQAAAPHPNHQYQQPYPQHQPPQPQKAPAPPDLLTDPFDIALPAQSSAQPAPAPPIPPNPEKEHLLRALSETLTAQAQQKIAQNLSCLAPLQAQHSALQAATHTLDAELRQLDHLAQQLASNEAILRASLARCDAVLASARSTPPPPVDDVLVAPTVVATQLWHALADEAACREAMYVLQRAVTQGRVGAADFVRHMRALGRERFLRVVVARKCARGLGLDVGG